MEKRISRKVKKKKNVMVYLLILMIYLLSVILRLVMFPNKVLVSSFSALVFIVLEIIFFVWLFSPIVDLLLKMVRKSFNDKVVKVIKNVLYTGFVVIFIINPISELFVAILGHNSSLKYRIEYIDQNKEYAYRKVNNDRGSGVEIFSLGPVNFKMINEGNSSLKRIEVLDLASKNPEFIGLENGVSAMSILDSYIGITDDMSTKESTEKIFSQSEKLDILLFPQLSNNISTITSNQKNAFEVYDESTTYCQKEYFVFYRMKDNFDGCYIKVLNSNIMRSMSSVGILLFRLTSSDDKIQDIPIMYLQHTFISPKQVENQGIYKGKLMWYEAINLNTLDDVRSLEEEAEKFYNKHKTPTICGVYDYEVCSPEFSKEEFRIELSKILKNYELIKV